jgi:hypothetical protein
VPVQWVPVLSRYRRLAPDRSFHRLDDLQQGDPCGRPGQAVAPPGADRRTFAATSGLRTLRRKVSEIPRALAIWWETTGRSGPAAARWASACSA